MPASAWHSALLDGSLTTSYAAWNRVAIRFTADGQLVEAVTSQPGGRALKVYVPRTVPALLLPGVVFAGLTLGRLSGYAAAVVRAGDVLRRPRIRRALDAIMGTALVVLGVRVVADAR